MSVSDDEKRTRRRRLLALGTGLAGLTTALGIRSLRSPPKTGTRTQARRLASRIRLPGTLDSMIRAYSRDPERVERFRELTRWREARARSPEKA